MHHYNDAYIQLANKTVAEKIKGNRKTHFPFLLSEGKKTVYWASVTFLQNYCFSVVRGRLADALFAIYCHKNECFVYLHLLVSSISMNIT